MLTRKSYPNLCQYLQDGIFVENKPESLGALGINKEFLSEKRQRVSDRRQEGNVTI